jgi:hypothetical protein
MAAWAENSSSLSKRFSKRFSKRRFRLTWDRREAEIAYDARRDGLFPLLTNDPALTAAQVLDAYKSKQPLVEKRHDLLKNVEAATPIYLKSISRIEAVLALHFIALLVYALLEQEVRRAMASRGITKLPLYPEDRDCQAPSADRILEIFAPLHGTMGWKSSKLLLAACVGSGSTPHYKSSTAMFVTRKLARVQCPTHTEPDASPSLSVRATNQLFCVSAVCQP